METVSTSTILIVILLLLHIMLHTDCALGDGVMFRHTTMDSQLVISTLLGSHLKFNFHKECHSYKELYMYLDNGTLTFKADPHEVINY